MIKQSFTDGLRRLRRHQGLVVLLYAMNLVIALVLSIPVAITLGTAVGPTGFGADLAAGFDIVLWADLIEEVGETLGGLQMQLLWMIPLYLVWKAAAGVGLVHALRGDGSRSFWQGVGRYAGRGVWLGLGFLAITLMSIVGVSILGLVLASSWTGEVGSFWVNFVIIPTLLISVLAVLDLMHDYARLALVIDEQPVLTALGTGLRWPLKHGQASWLYLLWFAPAAVLLLLPTVLDMNVAAATGGAIWGLFLAQQALLLARAGVTVGWLGSETALYETIRLREMPLIASSPEPAEDASPLAHDLPGTTPGDLASA